jgi:hypothetical protein
MLFACTWIVEGLNWAHDAPEPPAVSFTAPAKELMLVTVTVDEADEPAEIINVAGLLVTAMFGGGGGVVSDRGIMIECEIWPLLAVTLTL